MKKRPEYNMKQIGYNLKRLREAKNLSVEEVREYLRLGSVQAVYKYESGKNYPPVDTMFALMELYGADLKDIIGKREKAEGTCIVFGASEDILAVITGKQRGERLVRYLELYMQYARMVSSDVYG